MTLEEYIKMTDQNVKIGTNGGGFIYCGNIKDIDLNQLDKDSILKKVAYISDCQIMLGRIGAKLKSPKLYYERYCAATIGKPLNREKWLTQLKHEKEVKNRGIETSCYKLANYKRMKEREVVETYPSIAENACIVIIEGDEIGDYWSPDEYERSEK